MDNKQLQDEQELAKILAGVNNQMTSSANNADTDTQDNSNDDDLDSIMSQFQTTGPEMPVAETPQATETSIENQPSELNQQPAVEAQPEIQPQPDFQPTSQPEFNNLSDDLESIKNNAIQDLRPLVDKLNIPEDEKFDTYLLLIRSTDDKALIAPAYQAAKMIADDSKKAQALLDIVKEIDYLTNK